MTTGTDQGIKTITPADVMQSLTAGGSGAPFPRVCNFNRGVVTFGAPSGFASNQVEAGATAQVYGIAVNGEAVALTRAKELSIVNPTSFSFRVPRWLTQVVQVGDTNNLFEVHIKYPTNVSANRVHAFLVKLWGEIGPDQVQTF